MSRDNAQPDSSPETSAFRALRAVRIVAEGPRLLMSSCISASGIVNQRLFGARGLSMRGETIHGQARDGRPRTRPRHSTGPPPETSAHAIPCRKSAYARRKARTPRPEGQCAHPERCLHESLARRRARGCGTYADAYRQSHSYTTSSLGSVGVCPTTTGAPSRRSVHFFPDGHTALALQR